MDRNLENAMNQAKASIELEGTGITSEHTKLVKARLNNEISEDEFQERVKEMVLKRK